MPAASIIEETNMKIVELKVRIAGAGDIGKADLGSADDHHSAFGH